MKTVGIICEYNPLHSGHAKQIRRIRELLGRDTAIVCLMSGNYVQRGAPAIVDKSLRARAALEAGADLVLELPVTYVLSSAEGFAAGGVSVLSRICDYLCFGCETGKESALLTTAEALLSPQFPPALRAALDTGISFPAARQRALEAMGADGALLSLPNDILAVEYCKAILAQGCAMRPLPIRRKGSYHSPIPDPSDPSATALRARMLSGETVDAYVPAPSLLADAPLHSIRAGERAILARLRTMTDAEYEALPYGSEGLWRKLMHAGRSFASLEEIIAATKSKRYTRTRIDRMILCAFLGITADMLSSPAPYVRALAFNDKGRGLWKQLKAKMPGLNAGEAADHPYWTLEKRCEDLYGLFRLDTADPPGREEKRRILYVKETN